MTDTAQGGPEWVCHNPSNRRSRDAAVRPPVVEPSTSVPFSAAQRTAEISNAVGEGDTPYWPGERPFYGEGEEW